MNDAIVIGNGMMGRACSGITMRNTVLFCSGVSNSNEKSSLEFSRERKLLESILYKYNARKIVYFSSLIAKTGSSPYAIHKRDMELLIEKNASNYLVMRLPQVVGGTNNTTLIKYLLDCITLGKRIKVHKNSIRTLIDVEDVVRVVNLLLIRGDKNLTIDVGSIKSLPILEIIRFLEDKLGKKALINCVDDGDDQSIDLTGFFEILPINDVLLNDNYPYLTMEKYINRLVAD